MSVIEAAPRLDMIGNVDNNVRNAANGDIIVFDSGTRLWELSSSLPPGMVDLDDLTDVTITSGDKGDILVHNGTAWVDFTVGADNTFLVADSAQTEGIKWFDLFGTANTWTADQTFTNATVNTTLTLGSLDGILEATAGAVSGNAEDSSHTWGATQTIDLDKKWQFRDTGKYIQSDGATSLKIESDNNMVFTTPNLLFSVSATASLITTGTIWIGGANTGSSTLRFDTGSAVSFAEYSGGVPSATPVTIDTGGVTTTQQFTSSLATGTQPLDVSSTTVCTNLNAERWNSEQNTITSVADLDILQYDSGSSTWVNTAPAAAASGPFDSGNAFELYDDFGWKTGRADPYFNFRTSGHTGLTVAQFASSGLLVADHPGVVRFATPNTSGRWIGAFQNQNLLVIQGGESLTGIFHFDDVTDPVRFRFGLGNNTSNSAPTDGIYFQFLGGALPTWDTVTVKAATSTSNSGGSVSANWNKLAFVVNAAGTQVDFYIDDSLVQSNTTNIPGAGDEMSIFFTMENTTAAGMVIHWDLCHLKNGSISR